MKTVKELVRSVLSKLVEVIQVNFLDNKPGLYTPKDNPELIRAVTETMQEKNSTFILKRLEDISGKISDLEKAIYHIAVKQTDVVSSQKSLHEIAVANSTILEEMIHLVDHGSELASEPEDGFLVDAWEIKNGTHSTNN